MKLCSLNAVSRLVKVVALVVLVIVGVSSVSHGVTVSYVVHASLDGLGAKYLESYVTNAPTQFPNFVRLMSEGAFTFNARCDYDISETVPNHATMFTGRPVMRPADAPVTVNHCYNNNFPGAADTFPSGKVSAIATLTVLTNAPAAGTP